ncbi:MAG: TIGR03084 family protein [Desulfobacteraceae bacterium]|nr:MAG: TIGR03084 family protein [Desulfobacteraceae bacterium]
MQEICRDLTEEGQLIEDLVAGLNDDQWHRVTPFYGWTIKDEIAHIAFFDRMAKLSATDQKIFNEIFMAFAKDLTNFFRNTMAEGRAKSIPDLLAWWKTERRAMLSALEPLDPKTRLPWQLPMSARSLATARLMETWAHGQDIFDALQLKREPARRLRHIAHLGVATFGWSFSCHGRQVPSEAVRVELLGPSGEVWSWGPETARARIEGKAQDFCLVVTQRRHYKDTHLKVTGEVSQAWMELAQAFAGPPAAGPPGGTFSRM